MAEHEAVVEALTNGDGEAAAAVLREHVAGQGVKFHTLMASLKGAAE
jgi:DNA-binding GntR family transcriptional regulator